MNIEKINKQLQRQLKATIVNLKSNELQPLIKKFQDFSKIATLVSYQNKGPACIECVIKYYTITSSGFGRVQNQAYNNAIRNFFDSLISQSIQIDNLKSALKFAHQDSSRKEIKINLTKNMEKTDNIVNQSLNLDTDVNALDFSAIENLYVEDSKSTKKCGCIYTEVFQHNTRQIQNLSARIKLLNEENRVLKELLLKNFQIKNELGSQQKPKSFLKIGTQKQLYLSSETKQNKLNLSNI